MFKLDKTNQLKERAQEKALKPETHLFTPLVIL